MASATRVSVSVSGSHSVEPGSADRVYGHIEQALSGGSMAYDIRSSIPDHEFRREGNRGAGGPISVDLGQSSFTVGWSAPSAFSVPGAALDVVNDCLRPSRDVSLQASMALDRVPEALLGADPGLLVKRCLVAVFELATPDVEVAIPAGREVPFRGIAVHAGEGDASLLIFGERTSDAPNAPSIIEYMLGALSKYCEVYGR